MKERLARLGTVPAMIVRGAAVVASLQVLEQLTGLVSQMLIASYFGASAVTDAYLVALAAAGLIGLWITIPIRQVLIPMFRHDLAREGEAAAWGNTTILLNNLSIVYLVVVAAGWFLAPLLIRLIGAGFDAETSALATSLTRIFLALVILLGSTTFLAQLFYSYQSFFLPGLSGIVANLVVAGGLLLYGSRYGIHGLAVATVAGNAVQLLMHLPILWRHRRFYSPRIDFRHPRMRELWRLSLPVFLSTGGREINRISDRFFASLLAAGSVSALAFSRLLVTAPQMLVFEPLQKTIFPHFTKLAAEDDLPALSRQLFQFLRLVFFLSVPAAAGMILLDDLIVRAIFHRGAFDEEAVRRTSGALALFAVGLPAIFVGRILVSVFISLKDTRTVMRLSLLRIGVKIVLTLALIPYLAHGGIALAESISHVICTAGLFWALPAELKANETGATLRSMTGTVATAVVMCIAIYGLKNLSEGRVHDFVQLGSLVPAGIVVYFAAGRLSRRREVEWIGRNLAAITRR